MALTDGLLMRLPLDEGAGTSITDESGNRTCTASDESWITDATYGDVYVSTAANQIDCGAESVSGGTLTYAFWIFPTSLPSSNNYLIVKYGTGNDQRGFRLYITSSRNIILQATADGTSGSIGTQSTTTQPITLDEWNHVIVEFNAGEWDVYINNGTAEANDGDFAISTVFDSSDDLEVGRWSGVSEDGPEARLREVAIWNRILTSQERTDVFNDSWVESVNITIGVPTGPWR